MFFTLAVSASTADACTALTDRARVTDPRIMPIPGPAEVVWRSADGRAAILRWGTGPGAAALPAAAGADPVAGGDGPAAASHAATIWADREIPGGGHAPVYARTSLTRVDPVYAAELPGAAILSDRAMWAATVADRAGDFDSSHACALLNLGFPLGAVTPFAGVSALPPAATAHLLGGRLTVNTTRLNAVSFAPDTPESPSALASASLSAPLSGQIRNVGSASAVAAALVEAVAPLRALGEPVELSLTGGKDSRIIVAALVAAGVPVHAKTYGFAEHPDVLVATDVARRLGIEHTVTVPAEPGQKIDVAARVRATVLVADGMLSAFENVGRPDPSRSPTLTAGGHGGELLRGGYAETAAGRRAAPLRAAEILRRLTTKHIGLLRRSAAAAYLASLTPWTGVALAHGPLQALDDFYLVNRAGRWSAAARQAYLIRESLVQPLFDERVVAAARTVPLALRTSGALPRAVLTELCPALTDVPFAGKPAKGAVPTTFDWRRQYGPEIAAFFRDYTLDLGASSGLFDVVNRTAAEKVLTPPHEDRATVWTLATLACLLSGDYRDARTPSALLSVS